MLDPDDAQAWAETIAQVLEDGDLRARLIAQGRAQAATFTWQKAAIATLQLYRGAGVES